MAPTRTKRYAFAILLATLLIAQSECGRSGGGSRSSGGGSRSSSSHSSGSSHSSHGGGGGHTSLGGGTHSSFGGGTHSSFGGGTHSSFGGGTHSSGGSGTHHSSGTIHTPSSTNWQPPSTNTFGSGTHSSPPATHLGPSAPHLPGYTVTGGAAFVPHSTGGTRPIGFDNVNHQAQKPSSPTGGIGFDHHQQTHTTGLNSAKPIQTGPPGYTVTGGKPTGIGFEQAKPLGPPALGGSPPGYTVSGGAPLPSKPIGFDHVNQQAHNSKPPVPPVSGVGAPHHQGPVYGAPPGYSVSGGAPLPSKPAGGTPIGFDHVNQQAGRPVTSPPISPHHVQPSGTGYVPSAPPVSTGTRFDHPTYQPYRPQTVVQPSGYVHYQPPVQLQYAPPVIHHTTTHYVPVFQPTVIQTYSSPFSHTGSFLGGYLIGSLSHSHGGYYPYNNGYHNTHITNNYYNNDRPGTDNNYYSGNGGGTTGSTGNTYNSYYTVHHYHQNREQVPPKFSVPGEDLTQCQTNTTDQLCVPNTNAFCLKNGTIMCTTPSVLTTPCGQNSTDNCVYSKIECNGNPSCNITANQTYIDFYLPCISNVTYVDNKVVDNTPYKAQGSYQLCVTAIAHPKKLESPVMSVANLFMEFGKWHLDQLNNINAQKSGAQR